MLTVLHVITGLDVGGAETSLYNLVRATRGIDHSVVSLSTKGPLGSEIEALGVEVEAMGMRRRPSDSLRLPRLVARLRRRRPDVVHTWMIHANVLGGLAAFLARSRSTVWGLHHTALDGDDTPRTTLALDRLAARLSSRVPTRVVSCSRTAMDAHARAGYDPGRLVFIANGVDTDRFRPDPAARTALRAEWGLDPTTPLVGLVARFAAQKDHATFVEAARILSTERSDARFVLCGRGTATDPGLAAMLRSAGVRDRCLLLGERNDVERVLAALDVACLSSAYGEAAPVVLLEALACGVPCVATDLGDTADIVARHGRIVSPRDPRALAGGLSAVLDDPHPLAEGARAHVQAEFSIARMATAYTELYEAVRS